MHDAVAVDVGHCFKQTSNGSFGLPLLFLDCFICMGTSSNSGIDKDSKDNKTNTMKVLQTRLATNLFLL